MKKYVKKCLALCLSLAMVLSMLSVPASALEVDKQEDAAIVVTIGNGAITKTGETIDVPVTVEFAKDDAIFDAFGLKFDFNSNHIVMHESTGRRDPVINVDGTLCDSVTGSVANKTAAYADPSGYGIDKLYAEDMETNVLFYLRFDAVEGYVNGTYTIDADILDNQPGNFAYHSQGVDVYFVPGTITLTGGLDPAEITPAFDAAAQTSFSYVYNTAAPTLEAAATVVKSDDAVTYKWYKSTTAAALEGAEEIAGAAESTYAVPAGNAGVTYYGCVASNAYRGDIYTTEKWFTVTCEQAEINVSGASWDYTAAYTYDTTEQSVALKDIPAGAVAAYEGEKATNVGQYTAKATFTAEDAVNYKIVGSVADLSWEIVKAEFDLGDIAWDYDAALTYDAAEKAVVLKNIPTGVEVTYEGNKATAAGAYTAKVTLALTDEYNGNYKIVEEIPALNWEIAKAKIDVSGAAWDYASAYTYDTTEKSVVLKDLPAGVKADYSGNTATAAGEYVASVVLSAEDSANYEIVGTKPAELTWKIDQAQIDLGAIAWDYAAALTYTGAEQTVVLKDVPAGIVVAYTGNKATNVGSYTASADLSTEDVNYVVSGEVADLSWEIAKKTAGDLTDAKNLRYSNTNDQTYTAADIKALLGDTNADTIVTITGVEKAGDGVVGGNLTDGVVHYALTSGLVPEDEGKNDVLTISYTSNNYADGTVKLTVTVTDKIDVSSKITFVDGGAKYNGQSQKYEDASIEGFAGITAYKYADEQGVSVSEMKNVGTYKVTAIYEDEDHYGEVTVNYVINKVDVNFVSATAANKTFDGTTAAEITGVTLSGLVNGETLEAADYVVSGAAFADADAAAGKDVTFALALTGEKAINYNLVDVVGAAKADITPKAITVEIADIAAQTYTGSAITPAVTVTSADAVDGFELAYTVVYENNVDAGTATVKVDAVAGGNYTFSNTKDFTINKADITITAEDLTVEYKEYAADQIKGTAKFGDADIKGVWSWNAESALADKNAGDTGVVEVVFTPENASLNAAAANITVTINKSTQADAEPSYEKVQSGKTLADVALDLGDLADGTIVWIDSETGEEIPEEQLTEIKVEVNKAYTWKYVPADTANYEEKTGTITPYRYSAPAAPTFQITLADAENGTVKVNRVKAREEAKVTVTVTPAEGYELKALTVKDSTGAAVELTKVSDTKYTFLMPADDVTVAAVFGMPGEYGIFTDVAEADWFYDEVYYAYNKGLMNGTGETTFAPAAKLNRAMLATILYRMAGSPAVTGDNAFTDVADGQWYSDAITWAAANGVVTGTSATTFAPMKNLTREQLAVMLWRYAKLMGKDVSVGEETNILSYDDAMSISEYAIPAMQWAIGAGLVNGRTESTIVPQGNASRAEIAAVLMRFVENVK